MVCRNITLLQRKQQGRGVAHRDMEWRNWPTAFPTFINLKVQKEKRR